MFFRTSFTSPSISYRQQIQSVIITYVRYNSCNKFPAQRLSVFMQLAGRSFHQWLRERFKWTETWKNHQSFPPIMIPPPTRNEKFTFILKMSWSMEFGYFSKFRKSCGLDLKKLNIFIEGGRYKNMSKVLENFCWLL